MAAANPKPRLRAPLARVHLAGSALALLALALPATAQARCQVWRAMANADNAVLPDLVLRAGGNGGIDLAYLGVNDGPTGARDCELSDDGNFGIYCQWPVDTAADGERLVAAMQRGIEACLDTSMEVAPDSPGNGGVTMRYRRDLVLFEGEDNEITFGITMFEHTPDDLGPQRRTVALDYARYR